MIELGAHFERTASALKSPFQERLEHHAKAVRDQRLKDENLTDQNEAHLLDAVGTIVMATATQIEAFEHDLARYDEATVKALMKNQEKLDRLYEERDEMLDEAHVMEDGRRVFKDEAGTTVYDEHGSRVGEDTILADEIPDYKPRAEAYFGKLDAIEAAQRERSEILDFQNQLDDARDHVAEGEISADGLEDLDAKLKESMPTSVRAELPGFEGPQNAPNLAGAFSDSASIGSLAQRVPAALRESSTPLVPG